MEKEKTPSFKTALQFNCLYKKAQPIELGFENYLTIPS
jgi:hypothetical protein